MIAEGYSAAVDDGMLGPPVVVDASVVTPPPPTSVLSSSSSPLPLPMLPPAPRESRLTIETPANEDTSRRSTSWAPTDAPDVRIGPMCRGATTHRTTARIVLFMVPGAVRLAEKYEWELGAEVVCGGSRGVRWAVWGAGSRRARE